MSDHSIAGITRHAKSLREPQEHYRSARHDPLRKNTEYLEAQSRRLRADIAKLESEYRINQRLLEARRRER